MGTNIVDVKKEITSLDQKLLDMLVKRFELSVYMADAKYVLHEADGKVIIKDEERRKQLGAFFKENSLKKAKEKNLPNPEEFSKFVTRVAEETLIFSWETQKSYLKQKYNLKCD
jgi:chorismate mutase